MTLFVIGIILFFGVHFVPSMPLKSIMVNRLGEMRFKGLFSLISALGLGLIIYGFSLTKFQPLFDPLSWGRNAAIFTMPIAVILICAAQMPNNLKTLVRHPMLGGLILWGLSHLVANGDLASTILFASFVVFSIINILLVNARGPGVAPTPVSKLWDLGTIAIGLALYILLFQFHGVFAGIPLK